MNENVREIQNYIYSTRAIGRGSFSHVYKGLDLDADLIVAIKVIKNTEKNRTCIDREIQFLNTLNHRNIIKLYQHVSTEEEIYYILEYLGGGDLSSYISQYNGIDENRARLYMKQLADVFKYLRSYNIVHRDLKPQNILLSADYKVIKLTDFSFSRDLRDGDLTSTLCGSPLYMAPEILRREKYTSKTELWSIGIIMYEMLHGFTPYSDAMSVSDLTAKISKKKVKYSKHLSAECKYILKLLLQVDQVYRCSWLEFFNDNWINSKMSSVDVEVDLNNWEIIEDYKN